MNLILQVSADSSIQRARVPSDLGDMEANSSSKSSAEIELHDSTLLSPAPISDEQDELLDSPPLSPASMSDEPEVTPSKCTKRTLDDCDENSNTKSKRQCTEKITPFCEVKQKEVENLRDKLAIQKGFKVTYRKTEGRCYVLCGLCETEISLGNPKQGLYNWEVNIIFPT